MYTCIYMYLRACERPVVSGNSPGGISLIKAPSGAPAAMSNAILIRDIQGLKTPSGFGGVVKGLVRDLLHQKDDVHVLRGELLVPQECEDGAQGEDDQKRTPFQLFSDSQITVFCNAQDIAPLNHTEFQLLAGIKSPQARHKVFIDDGLDWGSRLVDGSHVSVALPSSNLSVPTMAVAIVRYVGPFPDELGLKFGVEIMVGEKIVHI